MNNPFVGCILPLGDNLVMHSALAVSGVRMINGRSNENLKFTAWTHYWLPVRGLRHALTQGVITDQADTARLLVTTLLLSHVEVNYLFA